MGPLLRGQKEKQGTVRCRQRLAGDVLRSEEAVHITPSEGRRVHGAVHAALDGRGAAATAIGPLASSRASSRGEPSFRPSSVKHRMSQPQVDCSLLNNTTVSNESNRSSSGCRGAQVKGRAQPFGEMVLDDG